MALKIRLKRMGKKNTPFYRLVVVDSRWRRDGKAIDNIGWYDPVKQPGQLAIKPKSIYQWLEKGAQLSETVRSILKREGIIDKFRSGAYKAEMELDTEVVTSVLPEAAPEPPKPKPVVEVKEETAKEESAPAETSAEESKEEAPASEESSSEETVETAESKE